MQKQTQFELKPDGSLERVGPFGSSGPTIRATNKTEAMAKFLAFAYRAAETTPRIKVRNGAYQLAYEGLSGISVEAGLEGRFALCCSGAKEWRDVTDETASFAYYASEEYRSAAA